MRGKPTNQSPSGENKKPAAETPRNDGRSRVVTYEAHFARIAKVICRLGGSDIDLAAALGVEEDKIHEWIREHADFREACRFGIDAADASVERSLLQRALGYDRTDVKVFRHRGRVIYAPYRVHVIPDVKAAIFWLVSRRPDVWSLKGGKAKPAESEADLAAMLRQMREMRMPGGAASPKPSS